MPELFATVLARAGMLLLEAVIVRVVQQIFVAFTKPSATAVA
ncbi:hypothetical protein [Amycolatopsis taiwanensis]|uniref:Uncharacterized protein n=1 Tax=Amycolatopsis taiwanensis TaxID=342230 RepID=A0A9W6QXI8_9PSEU|nr:hypothetical protein [Amycolatopsis taiwanensis]GLY65553.1 hypothetical protein Atai01_21720 [Amycolatopsis taiwanensis]